MAAGTEENMTPTRSQRLVYLVKAVAASLFEADPIAVAIDARLHHATLTVAGQTNFQTERLTEMRYTEEDPAGHFIGHAGGEYLIRMVGG
jgi:hypothetical protein